MTAWTGFTWRKTVSSCRFLLIFWGSKIVGFLGQLSHWQLQLYSLGLVSLIKPRTGVTSCASDNTCQDITSLFRVSLGQFERAPHADGRDRSVNDNVLSRGTTRTENSFELLVDWILKESAKHNARVFIEEMNVGGRCSVFSSRRGAWQKSRGRDVSFPFLAFSFWFIRVLQTSFREVALHESLA